MHAVLLCPGPSLSLLPFVPPAALVVAANRAALEFRASIWAAGDYPMVRDWHHSITGSPRLLTKRQTWLDIKRRAWFPEAIIIEDLGCPVEGFEEKTATGALAYLWSVGAKRVDVYGADWSDADDFDGFRMPGCERDEKRWARERGVWDRMCAELGMEVVRH